MYGVISDEELGQYERNRKRKQRKIWWNKITLHTNCMISTYVFRVTCKEAEKLTWNNKRIVLAERNQYRQTYMF